MAKLEDGTASGWLENRALTLKICERFYDECLFDRDLAVISGRLGNLMTAE